MIRPSLSQPVAPSRVVVLGASGFVGGDLCRHLGSLGIELVATSSKSLDLCDAASVPRLADLLRHDDVLVFVSALTPDKGRDIRTFMRNLSMAEHVCAALAIRPCAHVVYVSSDAVYADGANPVRETSPCSPSSFHGLMHLAREQMLMHATGATKIPLLTLRPTLLYGAADTHNGYGPNRFVRLAASGQNIRLFGSGEEQRDHVAISDLSRLVERCVLQRHEGILNVATGRASSFMDVARFVTKQSQVPVEIECLPRQTPITHRHFDITESIRAFPDFSYIPLSVGLAVMAPPVSS